jgi:hypothetical protein
MQQHQRREKIAVSETTRRRNLRARTRSRAAAAFDDKTFDAIFEGNAKAAQRNIQLYIKRA